MATEHHVQGNEKEERAEYLPQDMSLDLRGDDGTDRRTEEEAKREEAREVVVPSCVGLICAGPRQCSANR